MADRAKEKRKIANTSFKSVGKDQSKHRNLHMVRVSLLFFHETNFEVTFILLEEMKSIIYKLYCKEK